MSRKEDSARVGASQHEEDIVAALRTFDEESSLRSKASDPNLHAGRVQVVQVFALDIAELVDNARESRRTLQRLRASGELYDKLDEALVGHVSECESTRREIEERREKALSLQGKAVWTEQFVERFAPLTLPVPKPLKHGDSTASLGRRLSPDRQSELHRVELEGVKMQMFREGTICFTFKTQFVEGPEGDEVHPRPVKAAQIIERLELLDEVAVGCFHSALASFFCSQDVQARLKAHLRAPGHDLIEFFCPNDKLTTAVLKRKAKAHTLILVEHFYDGKKIEKLYEEKGYDGRKNHKAIVPLEAVLASSALAGILNTAKWFHNYNRRYVSELSDKEIGYRNDEIYLTDRKATVISTAGLWDMNDSLSTYLYDIVLAVEYNVARLAYFASTLAYYQAHQDASSVLESDPMEALELVVDGRSVLSRIVESLDLTLLVNHGFTRLFVERLRQELGFDAAIEFIRQRIEDASTSIDLRASVEAAAHTSKESLAAARENNVWAKAAVVVAILVAIAVGVLTLALHADETTTKLDPTTHLCLDRNPPKTGAPVCISAQGGNP